MRRQGGGGRSGLVRRRDRSRHRPGGGDLVPPPVLCEGQSRDRPGADRPRRAEGCARRGLPRAALPPQGGRGQHADLEARDRAGRPCLRDHRGPPPRRCRGGVLRPGPGHQGGGRDRRPGPRRQDLPRHRAGGDPRGQARERGALRRGRLHHGEPSGRARQVHRGGEPGPRRGPRPERPPARIGVAHPARPDPLPRPRREQRVQRPRDAPPRRDHRRQQEGARGDRVGCRGLGASEPAQHDQAEASPLPGGGGSDDRPAA